MKVGSVIANSFVKNVPNIHECWLAPVSLRGLTTKGVNEVSYNRYGQIIERVCNNISANIVKKTRSAAMVNQFHRILSKS